MRLLSSSAERDMTERVKMINPVSLVSVSVYC